MMEKPRIFYEYWLHYSHLVVQKCFWVGHCAEILRIKRIEERRGQTNSQCMCICT